MNTIIRALCAAFVITVMIIAVAVALYNDNKERVIKECIKNNAIEECQKLVNGM